MYIVVMRRVVRRAIDSIQEKDRNVANKFISHGGTSEAVALLFFSCRGRDALGILLRGLLDYLSIK